MNLADNSNVFLRAQNAKLLAENKRLKHLLQAHGITFETNSQSADSATADHHEINARLPAISQENAILTKHSPFADRITLFLSLFHGREDVYARRWESKNGKAGYSPVCQNEWDKILCGKPKLKCSDCPNAAYLPFDGAAVERHLSGREVLGIYAILPDDTCHLLALDFDEENWRDDVRAVRQACAEHRLPCAVEISRSGNGAHVWFFFEKPVQAAHARRLGGQIITWAMQHHARLHFASYDRMFPNQDTMPRGGFGNLIALPFQREAFWRGGSVFVDEDFAPYPDQWSFLSSIVRISPKSLEQLLCMDAQDGLGNLRQVEDEEAAPWQKPQESGRALAWPSHMHCVQAKQLYIPAADLPQRTQNAIKRLAAFRNPEFYRAQAMRMPVWNIPRVICCAEYQGEYLCLPRGCRDELIRLAESSNTMIAWDDLRSSGKRIHVSFCGSLRVAQQTAMEALSRFEDGVLSATTAFGKTVVGAALIAEKQVNTLILVHRQQLLNQWKERLTQFLDIQETLPEEQPRRGRKRKRELIGTFASGTDRRSGIIDVAMLQSIGADEHTPAWLTDYGMVIVDECHHVPAVSFEQVLKRVSARYVYGLTATPTRKDGHHPILHMYLGPIRYQVDAKAQAMLRPFVHFMIPRFTGMRFAPAENGQPLMISQYYAQIQSDDLRNQLIVDDVLACVKEKRNCLLLSERTAHIQRLADMLEAHGQRVYTLTGGHTAKQEALQLTALRNAPDDVPLILCATGKYIGEGFDEPRLDTLFLTMPISWQGTLAQYAGRLHRLYAGKKEVRVYDYIDSNSAMLEHMYHKRLRGYAAIGYQVSAGTENPGVSGDMLYDQNPFQEQFLRDLFAARSSIVITSPYATVRRIRWLEAALRDATSRGVSVTIRTRPPQCFSSKSIHSAEAAIQLMTETGVHVVQQEGIHQKYAIIDDRIVWYGSINLLSFGASQESIMRLVSGGVAKALEKDHCAS